MLLSRSLNAVVLGPIAVICALAASGCDRQSGEPAQQRPASNAQSKAISGTVDRSHAGEALPDFSLKDAQGEELALPSLKGQPVLINLWATWCAPCITELPTLQALAADPQANLRVLTVSQDMGDPQEVAAFLDERGFTRLPSLLDPEGDLAFHYRTGVLPTTILYDAQGREVWRYVGGNEWTSGEARALLAEAQGD